MTNVPRFALSGFLILFIVVAAAEDSKLASNEAEHEAEYSSVGNARPHKAHAPRLIRHEEEPLRATVTSEGASLISVRRGKGGHKRSKWWKELNGETMSDDDVMTRDDESEEVISSRKPGRRKGDAALFAKEEILQEAGLCNLLIGPSYAKLLPDSHITSGSVAQDYGLSDVPQNSRIDYDHVSYCGAVPVKDGNAENKEAPPEETCFLVYDFRTVVVPSITVTHVATAGRQDHSPVWVTNFTLYWGNDGVVWDHSQSFEGNFDASTVVTHKLNSVVTARFVKLVATAISGEHGLELEKRHGRCCFRADFSCCGTACNSANVQPNDDGQFRIWNDDGINKYGRVRPVHDDGYGTSRQNDDDTVPAATTTHLQDMHTDDTMKNTTKAGSTSASLHVMVVFVSLLFRRFQF